MTLEQRIGYSFRRKELLEEALTHPSAAQASGNNQRLEFLGDRVLGLMMAELLLEMYPRENEGDIAKRHAVLVSGEQLAAVAQHIGIAGELVMAASEDASGGRENPASLADACEALIGALYIDGGIEPARDFVHRYWKQAAASAVAPPRDAKTALQEWAQGRGLPLPEYKVVEHSGPAHAPQFTVEVSVQGRPPQRGSGASKRAAEQQAAKALLDHV